MPPSCRPPPLLHLAQACSTCLALSTAAAAGDWLAGEGDGCLAAWAIAFGLSLLLLLAETTGRSPCSPASPAAPRRDVPLVLAAAASPACAAAAVLWALGHLRGASGSHEKSLRAVAAAASCLASLLYAWEVTRDRARPGEAAPYLATPSGLLKVLETFVSLLLLGLAAEQGAGSGPTAWRWCLAFYCGSFAAGSLLVAACLAGWGWCWCGRSGGSGAGWCWPWGSDPGAARRGLGVYAALGVAAYGAASVLWPLYGFREEFGGQPKRPPGCSPSCPWDRRVLVALLTPLNLLAYLVDLVQTGRLVLLRV